MNLTWCLKVLEKKGAAQGFLQRLTNLYSNNLSVVVVNNTAGAAVKNIHLTLQRTALLTSLNFQLRICYELFHDELKLEHHTF